MTISSIGSSMTLLSHYAVTARDKIIDLQAQLATGKKATSYSGMGPGEGLAITARAQIADANVFGDTIKNVNTIIGVANEGLQAIEDGRRTVQSALLTAPVTLDSNGQTTGQHIAKSQLSSMLGLLNSRAGERYVFSGGATGTPAVATIDEILYGSGALAGVTQMITERQLADLGVGSMARLTLSAPGVGVTDVTITEDGSPFGLKLNSITSSLTGSTVTPPAGAPPAANIDLGPVNPNDGEEVTFTFNLPDGTTEEFTLTATTTNPPPEGSFLIDTTSDLTATNLNAAIATAIQKLANTTLAAASAITATNSFFSGTPQRVDGAPATSMALVAATAADTVTWYTGDAGGGPARATAVARVDYSVTVQYGVRANEQAIRIQLQNAAVLAAFTTNPTSTDAPVQSAALMQRVKDNMVTQPGQQTVPSIQVELANAQNIMKDASARQVQAKASLQTLVDSTENVSSEEVITKMLALQTSLQASYQTTSMLSRLTLINYLPVV